MGHRTGPDAGDNPAEVLQDARLGFRTGHPVLVAGQLARQHIIHRAREDSAPLLEDAVVGAAA